MAYKGFADKWDWVMAALVAVVIFAVMLVWCGRGLAAEVHLTWEASDFESVGSDPEKSGYKLYRSYNEGANTEIVDEHIPMTSVSYGPVEEPGPGKVCYFMTAFNQFNESALSKPACDYIATGPPPVPQGLMLLLQEIITRLDTIIEKIG